MGKSSLVFVHRGTYKYTTLYLLSRHSLPPPFVSLWVDQLRRNYSYYVALTDSLRHLQSTHKQEACAYAHHESDLLTLGSPQCNISGPWLIKLIACTCYRQFCNNHIGSNAGKVLFIVLVARSVFS